MKRTPIIIPGQVYLHNDYNDYLVVTKANRGNISYAGPGYRGMHEAELFLERFSPVDPVDLTADEQEVLLTIADTKLSTGWVTPDDDGDEDDEY